MKGLIKVLTLLFMALVSKKFGIVDVKDDHTISLVNAVYNISSNVLANRLSMVVENLISTPQNAFLSKV